MNGAFNAYLKDDVVAADVLKDLGVLAPALHIDEIIDGLGRREVEKLLNLVPATTVFINIGNTWDGEEETLAGLTAGRYIEKIFISECNHEIRELPQSARKVTVKTTGDCAAIRNIIGMEHIKEITLVGGRVDLHTWVRLNERATRMSKLEFIGSEIENIRYGRGGIKKVCEFKAVEAKIGGVPITQEEIVAMMRN